MHNGWLCVIDTGTQTHLSEELIDLQSEQIRLEQTLRLTQLLQLSLCRCCIELLPNKSKWMRRDESCENRVSGTVFQQYSLSLWWWWCVCVCIGRTWVRHTVVLPTRAARGNNAITPRWNMLPHRVAAWQQDDVAYTARACVFHVQCTRRDESQPSPTV